MLISDENQRDTKEKDHMGAGKHGEVDGAPCLC